MHLVTDHQLLICFAYKLPTGPPCRCQKLPKGSPGRPCDKCKAQNMLRNAKAVASGAALKGVQKYQRTNKGRSTQRGMG